MSDEEETFIRNPDVERAAVQVLGYREDQVKRLTISQLERELEISAPRKVNRLKQLQQLLEKRKNFTPVLENDPDFDDSDLEAWDESLERLEKEIERESSGRERWERRQRKLLKMEEDNLLDVTLAKKWAEKQNINKGV